MSSRSALSTTTRTAGFAATGFWTAVLAGPALIALVAFVAAIPPQHQHQEQLRIAGALGPTSEPATIRAAWGGRGQVVDVDDEDNDDDDWAQQQEEEQDEEEQQEQDQLNEEQAQQALQQAEQQIQESEQEAEEQNEQAEQQALQDEQQAQLDEQQAGQ